jgi:hypothetical protein
MFVPCAMACQTLFTLLTCASVAAVLVGLLFSTIFGHFLVSVKAKTLRDADSDLFVEKSMNNAGDVEMQTQTLLSDQC